jgi:hypothetical protein
MMGEAICSLLGDSRRMAKMGREPRQFVSRQLMLTEALPAVMARRRLHLSNLMRNNYDRRIDGLHRFHKENIDRLRAHRTAGGFTS